MKILVMIQLYLQRVFHLILILDKYLVVKFISITKNILEQNMVWFLNYIGEIFTKMLYMNSIEIILKKVKLLEQDNLYSGNLIKNFCKLGKMEKLEFQLLMLEWEKWMLLDICIIDSVWSQPCILSIISNNLGGMENNISPKLS